MRIKINHLAAHGFSPALLQLWSERFGGEDLLPLQEEVVTRTGLLKGESLLISAATSAGKTFAAELAAALHLEHRKRVIYLVPTKALAEEKFRAFERDFSQMGWRVSCAIHERPETDPPVLRGDFDLLVAVYEKLKGYLVQHPEFLHNVGVVILDEVQNLGDANRGSTLEFLGAKLAAAPYRPQLIALSAVVGNPREVADSMGCSIWEHADRPIELREGVLDIENGEFRYISSQSGKRAVEHLLNNEIVLNDEPDEWRREAMLALTKHLAADKGEQVMLFVPSRAVSRRWAGMLAEDIGLPAAVKALESVEELEASHSRSLLQECLRAGVAFHNADLSIHLREAIEQYYNKGDIRVIVSTSTLAQGVNLMSRNVLQAPAMVDQDEWTGRPIFVPVSRQIFRNQGGRAGRLGRIEGFGRSILLAAGEEEQERLLREYVEAALEPVPARMAGERLDKFILDLIATGLYQTKETLAEFFQKSYSGLQHWRRSPGELDEAIATSLDTLEKGRLIEKPSPWLMDEFQNEGDELEEGAFITTGLGQAAAVSGIKPGTARCFYLWLEEFLNSPRDGTWQAATPLEIFFMLALTPDAADAAIPIGQAERRNARYFARVKERLAPLLQGRSSTLLPILNSTHGHTDKIELAAKKALLLETWISDAPTIEIENRFETFGGTIQNSASYFLWLAQSLARAVDLLDMPPAFARFIERLAERLYHGVPEEAVALSRLRLPSLHRQHIIALAREGFQRARDLQEADEETLGHIIGESTAKKIKIALTPKEETTKLKTNPALPEDIDDSASKINSIADVKITLDTSHPGEVNICGQKIYMPPLPYRLLLCLCRKPQTILSYTDIHTFVWGSDVIVERQQITYHKRNVLGLLESVLGRRLAAELITVRQGHGLEFNLPPNQIKISIDG